ncbi:MAG TPA: hypothetical protein VFP59_10675 [Candidatus Angelobacter sp.]|nr:hypothetical protein [Candidatus Angelobacter sp.]
MLFNTPLRIFLFVSAALFTLHLGAETRRDNAAVRHRILAVVSTSAETTQVRQESHEQQSSAQKPALPSDATAYVREVIHNELEMDARDHSHWRYRAHREDDKSNYDRDIIETKDGEIGRTLLLYGRPLSAEQQQQDQARMQKLVTDASEQAKRTRREKADSEKAEQMFKAIPDAFIFKYDGIEKGLVRLSFFPNPNYDPPTRELRVFRSLSGKMWIDPNQKHVVSIEGQLFQDVTFGWGILARLYKGGTFVVNRREVGPGHWEMVSLNVNMSGHAMLFKNIAVKERQTQTEFRRVPDNLSMTEAYHMLQKDSPVSANNQPVPAVSHR